MAMKGLWQRLTTPSSSRSGAEDDDDIDSDHGGGVDGQVDTADNENELDGDSGDRSVVQRRSLPLAVSGVGQLRTAVHVASAVADTVCVFVCKHVTVLTVYSPSYTIVWSQGVV